ncbi:MAG: hypothetical protein Q8M24_04680 [Pseudolabrys sp.]|nr:hypothetical protein [Pseudolabrys sp.]MDP2294741.1 hypothetical protein [Pseudolabrys sp.]
MPASVCLPPLVIPQGDGDMPLFCAAQWIATAGGSKSIDLTDEGVWLPAYRGLLDAIISGQVSVTGTDENADRCIIPAEKFSHCAVQHPYHIKDFDIAVGPSAWLLQSFPYEDDDEWDDWRGGFSDSLKNKNGKGWSQLTLLKSEILKRWPFDGPDQYKSGKPGRPSPKALIADEFEAIVERGELVSGIGHQSRILAKWLANTHPKARKIGAKSIEALLREKGYWEKIELKK